MRVQILVTHLLGSGHLSRALTVARAFAGAGHETQVVSGGMPAPHLDTTGTDLVQLPPVRSDGINFTTLLNARGEIADSDTLATRRATLAHALTAFKPGVLITELYPFGRRVLREEFQSALTRAAELDPRPLILSSVRDILSPPSTTAKADATHEVLERFYDGVLVHSDAGVMPLEASWPVTPGLNTRLHYTGFVTGARRPGRHTNPSGEIIISTGGSAAADRLFSTVLTTAERMPAHLFRLLVAGDRSEDRMVDLRRSAARNVIVEPARQDFTALLSGAAASVSLCGYNTALDVLQTGVPAVFVPFDAGGETEQTLRATTLARQSNIRTLKDAEMTGDTLAKALQDVIAAPARPLPAENTFDGARETVRLCEKLRSEKT
ncbi:glycosyltransferase [uncultured Roseobacter sp.]|uniref:glycosyltransferase family protein n=1 Tax=uncultured Roseobacter sp. TaxID=114847 RepID=UPI00262EF99D|nr:glycosyltransferase [uncultured Roseobacter sp.]